MKPYDQGATAPGARAAPAPGTTAARLPPGGGARAAGRDPLRGLADVGPDAAGPGAPKPSLWTRIKRAFQYGSQGGARG